MQPDVTGFLSPSVKSKPIFDLPFLQSSFASVADKKQWMNTSSSAQWVQKQSISP